MTSGTPASHFFLSPPEDGLSSGDMEEASEGSLGEKKLSKTSETEALLCIHSEQSKFKLAKFPLHKHRRVVLITVITGKRNHQEIVSFNSKINTMKDSTMKLL